MDGPFEVDGSVAVVGTAVDGPADFSVGVVGTAVVMTAVDGPALIGPEVDGSVMAKFEPAGISSMIKCLLHMTTANRYISSRCETKLLLREWNPR